ncbi:CoA transferase [Acidovorax sp. CCYZU-2555]|uniref:CaiB/BaiF CoA transferase family protein n=1 Tax=Acidovorax sp. CCYZU-2555 TaxID=2835042 RepID=UPI001BCF2EFC|nr:CoA transferase [Acidovorax sp. CCYZU-2555]MBS7777509.1 CoA transferase [Acidovorax sp. CCYZU-2555]
MSRAGALQGLKVVDLTRVLAGPLCTQILADHGAEVTKVEPPAGDETRRLGPPYTASQQAAYFSALNRGKQSISLDLSTPDGQQVLHGLLAGADVLVENFVPGTLERWGLGYEDVLAARYPRLVLCSISGFGADGPLGGLPGYDAVLQAACGIMSINGSADSGATKVGIPVVDHLTGYVALTGILMALQARERDGLGQRVEATLYDTAISLLLPHGANWLCSGEVPAPLGSAHPNIVPYDKFRAADGELFIGILNDAQFGRFCAAIGAPALAADPRFANNAQRLGQRDALYAAIEAAIATQPAQVWADALMAVGVPASAVNSVAAALDHPHTQHRQMLVRRGDYTGIRSPVRLMGTPAVPGAAPPRLDQDRAAILARSWQAQAQAQGQVTAGLAQAPAQASARKMQEGHAITQH